MKPETDYVHLARTRHHKALERLYSGRELKTGMQLWRSLRKIECDASRAAVAYCNAEKFTLYRGHGDPIVADFRTDGSAAWEKIIPILHGRVEKVLGSLPEGFFVNGDPRGYALKLDPEKTTVPEGMHTDFGRYGILAPEIN